MEKLPETERECHMCEDGKYVRDGSEIICSTCYHVPQHADRGRRTVEGTWESFWAARDEYSGFSGPERVKMVGGFAGAY